MFVKKHTNRVWNGIMIFILCSTMLFLFCGCGSKISNFEKAVKNGKYLEAISIYEQTIYGDSIKEQECVNFFRSYLDDSLSSFADGSIGDSEISAIIDTAYNVNEQINIIPDINSYKMQYHNIVDSQKNYEKGLEKLNDKDYKSALSYLNKVSEDDKKNYKDAQEKIDEAYQGIKDEFNSLSQDNLAVIQLYNDYIDSSINLNTEIEKIYNECKDKYIDKKLSESETAFGNDKNYSKAIKVLQLARGESGLTDFDSKIDYYSEYEPINLSELDYVKKGRGICVEWENGSSANKKDVNEKSYYGTGIIYSGVSVALSSQKPSSEEDTYITFNLGQKYNVLKGTIYRPYETLSCTETWDNSPSNPSVVRIYGDGVKLYESPQITQQTYNPIKFDVGITEVRELKIVVWGTWTENVPLTPGLYDYNPKLCLTNVTAQK